MYREAPGTRRSIQLLKEVKYGFEGSQMIGADAGHQRQSEVFARRPTGGRPVDNAADGALCGGY